MSRWAPEPFTSYDEYKHSLGEPGPEDLRAWRDGTGLEESLAHEELLLEDADSPLARAALQTILKTGKRSRFRVLAIVCRKNHTIAEVYRTGGGLVLTGIGPQQIASAHNAGGVLPGHLHPEYGSIGDTEWEYTWEQTRRKNRQQSVVCFVRALWREDGGRATVTMSCRCLTTHFGSDDIERFMKTGKRRVVYDKAAQRK